MLYPVNNWIRLLKATDESVLWYLDDLSFEGGAICGNFKYNCRKVVSKVNLRPTNLDGHDGDIVHMYIDGTKVAEAIVHHVNDSKLCHGTPLGTLRISIWV